MSSIKALSEKIKNKKIDNLFIIGGDPVYDAPVDLDFSSSIKVCENVVHLTDLFNHTSHLSTWVIPKLSTYESWMDLESKGGIVSFVQPLIQPLVQGFSELSFILKLLQLNMSDYAALRKYYRGMLKESFDSVWSKSLHDGVVSKLKPLFYRKSYNKKRFCFLP